MMNQVNHTEVDFFIKNKKMKGEVNGHNYY